MTQELHNPHYNHKFGSGASTARGCPSYINVKKHLIKKVPGQTDDVYFSVVSQKLNIDKDASERRRSLTS
jgi:hypothetical protein